MPEECCTSEGAGSATCAVCLPQAAAEPLQRACPACHVVGKPVQGQTVKALLGVTLRAVGEGAYRFCRTPACAVVYYAEDGSAAFTTEQVRVAVYQKEPDNPEALVCYCFRHSVREVAGSGAEARAAILHDITSGIEAGQCACDLRNPQGTCCLGNVRALAMRATEARASEPF